MSGKVSAPLTLTLIAAALLCACAAPVEQKSPAAAVHEAERIFPPWQHGANNDAIKRGLEFTVPQVDVLADFHGDLSDPKLVLYVGGNYFFALAPLVKEFEDEHPEFKGRIYWETIPPGMLVDQIKAGGTVTSGNMTWTIKGDAYFAGLNAVKGLIDQGLLDGPAVPYVTNTLAIMVAKGNPRGIAGLADLGKPDMRLAMPNPKYEGIARQIKSSLEKAGGEALARQVYETKVADGSAVLTFIHHRQTPLFLMQGVADAGVTWQSEAMFQEQAGNPIGHVEIPAAQNSTEIYAGAVIKGAAHPEAARLWLGYIHSAPALAIFERYGFHAYRELP